MSDLSEISVLLISIIFLYVSALLRYMETTPSVITRPNSLLLAYMILTIVKEALG